MLLEIINCTMWTLIIFYIKKNDWMKDTLTKFAGFHYAPINLETEDDLRNYLIDYLYVINSSEEV